MNQRNIDELIDAASRDMVCREPRAALTQRVITRVRADIPAAGRVSSWIPAAAAVSVAATVLLLVSWSIDTTVPPVALPVLPQVRSVASPGMPEAPLGTSASVATDRSQNPAVAPSIANARTAAQEPVPAPEPIAVTAIDITSIAREVTAIDHLEIDPLIVTPLTTSND